MNDVHSQWDSHKLSDDEKLSWAQYRKDIYGFMTGKKFIICARVEFFLTHLEIIF